MAPHTLRLGILKDSGAPQGSTTYTTIVLLHGYGWQSGKISLNLAGMGGEGTQIPPFAY